MKVRISLRTTQADPAPHCLHESRQKVGGIVEYLIRLSRYTGWCVFHGGIVALLKFPRCGTIIDSFHAPLIAIIIWVHEKINVHADEGMTGERNEKSADRAFNGRRINAKTAYLELHGRDEVWSDCRRMSCAVTVVCICHYHTVRSSLALKKLLHCKKTAYKSWSLAFEISAHPAVIWSVWFFFKVKRIWVTTGISLSVCPTKFVFFCC